MQELFGTYLGLWDKTLAATGKIKKYLGIINTVDIF
jgi:hypothetical protein